MFSVYLFNIIKYIDCKYIVKPLIMSFGILYEATI